MTDLTDRMRTCAAAIVAGAPDQPFMEWQLVYRDAADLLNEAADVLDMPLPAGRQETIAETRAKLGEPMEVIPPIGHEADATQHFSPLGTWIAPGGPLPGLKHSGTVSMRTCPKCDSRVQKTARRVGDALMLKCPVCGHQWTWRKG